MSSGNPYQPPDEHNDDEDSVVPDILRIFAALLALTGVCVVLVIILLIAV